MAYDLQAAFHGPQGMRASSFLSAGADDEAGGPIQRALDWVHEHYQTFLDLGPRLVELQHRAAAVELDAAGAGDEERADTAATVVASLRSIRGRWEWSAGKLAWIVSQVQGLGAWIIPVAVSAVALVVVGVAATVMYQSGQAERVLDMLETGELTVHEARELGLDVGGSPFVTFSAGAGVAVVAGVAWWLWRGNRSR